MQGIVIKGMARAYLLLVSTRHGRRAGSRAIGFDTPALVEMRRKPLDRGYMNRSVSWELKHIPRGEKGSVQNFLRFSYNALRRKHMTLGKTRHDTLKELIKKTRRAHPDFIPQYDKDIFEI